MSGQDQNSINPAELKRLVDLLQYQKGAVVSHVLFVYSTIAGARHQVEVITHQDI